jgi:hypothetical protein
MVHPPCIPSRRQPLADPSGENRLAMIGQVCIKPHIVGLHVLRGNHLQPN